MRAEFAISSNDVQVFGGPGSDTGRGRPRESVRSLRNRCSEVDRPREPRGTTNRSATRIDRG